MKKLLFISIIATVFFTMAFISIVLITEQRNTIELKEKYSSAGQTAGSRIVAVPASTQKAFDYQRSKVMVWIANLLLSMLVPALFLFSGLSASIRKWAMGRSSRIIVVIVIYFIIYSIISYLLEFPLDYYSGFVSKHAFGLSNQTFWKWLGDALKGQMLYTFAVAAFIWIPYTIIKTSPRYWWLYVGLLFIPVSLFISYISPLYIDPLFNRFEPVKNAVLEAEIRNQLNRTVIGDCKVYQIDKSADTKEMNAYMTGVFNTKRIVLWDTTINRLTNREVLCVAAHEMGHYLMGHVWKSIVLGGGLCILILYLVNISALWVIDRSGGLFGVDRLCDIASLPLLILLINISMFIAAPGVNAYSRHIEKEADRFELELTQDNHAVVTATVKLHDQNLTIPRPGIVYKLWNYDHPTYEERVDFANNYKPWEEHKPLMYQKYLFNGNAPAIPYDMEVQKSRLSSR